MSAAARRTGMRSIAFVVIGLAVALGRAAHADVLKVGDRAVELDVAEDAAGKAFKLKSLKGSWYLVTVGAHWCEPCKKELPTWDKLAPEFKGKLTFVAVNISDKIEDGKRFMTQLGIKHMTVAFMPQKKSGVVDRYGADHMPSTFVVDPKGVVRLVREGFEKGDADGELGKMREALTTLLK
jgi:thiol-disulfide isomerase/thioredoxin